MNNLAFLFQYLLKPTSVGAIIPSSSFLAEKMLKNIDFHTAKVIIEYGPGTGVFTEKLVEKRLPHTKVILIEKNTDFYEILIKKFGHLQNIYIINDSAEKIESYLGDLNIYKVDYVISGLPFASLPKKVSKTILEKTKWILGEEGKFVTFQYTQRKIKFINKYFNKMNVERELRNLPPAYVLTCQN